jgi:hypothetical protein
MSDERRSALTFPLAAGVLLSAACCVARADVTMQQLTTLDFGFIKQHGTTTEYLTTDKRRLDTDAQCEGFMAMFCKDAQTGDIVRLDRSLSWSLTPKDKQYREIPFPTPAQRQAAEQQALANMEKLKQCPAAQQQAKPAGPDTSKCQMSPPKFDIKQVGTHATIAGHDTQLTQISLTQSCTDPSTGDTCDMLFLFDSWLTQETLPGAEDRKAFAEEYAKKTGLTAADTALVQQRMKQFLAGYSGSFKDLAAKAGELKGYPLKTSLRMAFGGEHCAAAKNAAQSGGAGGTNAFGDASKAAGDAATNSASGAAGSAAGNAASQAAGNGPGGSILNSAASAFGSKLVTGLFAKKTTNNATPAPTTAATATSPLPPGMIQTAEISTETTSITTTAVPASEFDIPAGWTLIQPKASEDKAFSCPK